MNEIATLIKCCSFGLNDDIEGQLLLKLNLHRTSNKGYLRTDNNVLTQNMSERILQKDCKLILDNDYLVQGKTALEGITQF